MSDVQGMVFLAAVFAYAFVSILMMEDDLHEVDY